MENLHTVRGRTEITVEIKKSQFIAHLFPISDFHTTLALLKKNHKKARHFVWATRQLNDRQQLEENCTDDGEPRNTSGKPTLKVLQGHNIVDAGIITVRYFGGIKLGTGGLVRAYNEAAQQVVLHAPLIPLSNLYSKTVRIPYQQIRHTEYQLKQHAIKVLHKDFATDHIILTLQGDKAVIAEAFGRIETLPLSSEENK